MPEAVHASESVRVRGEEIGPVGKYGKEETLGNAVAKEGSYACPWEGQASDKGDINVPAPCSHGGEECS